MTMQLYQNDESLGEFATVQGYHDLTEYLMKDNSTSSRLLKNFFEKGETFSPEEVAKQAKQCASKAPQELRGSLMALYKQLKDKKGRVIIDS